MKKEHSDRGHSSLGGSSAVRWSNCTGSVFLSKEIPEIPAGPAALEGTKAHELCDILLAQKIKYWEEGVVGEGIPGADPTMIAYAHDYVDAIWEKVLFESITGKAYGIEDRFTLHPDLDMFGYIDFWCVYIDDKGKKVGCIVDYKYGFNSVSAIDNYQLAYYGVALREEMRSQGVTIDYIRGVIFQPRIVSEEAYREHVFTKAQLDKFQKKFIDAGKQIYIQKKAKFKKGDWCKYCPAQIKCPTYQEYLAEETALKLIEPELSSLPDITSMPDSFVSKLIEHEDEFLSLFSAAKKYSFNRAINGNPIAGTKLVLTKSRRKWKNNTDTIEAELNKLGVENLVTKKLNALTTVEKELKKIVGGKEAREILDDLVDYSNPTPIVVPESDPREAVTTPAQDLLLDINDETFDE